MIGHRLGPYEILAKLGEGGMGEVYRATDTNLKRQVAIKVLPPSLGSDADRLARFQREAEVLASLNHPNIASIYGLERADGRTALVMELVEGPTLADRIALSAFPVDEALPIAKQIADALDAAHERGIVHRDLKPANIKVTPDGAVKVLDFGLAKATEAGDAGSAGGQSPSISPTMTSPAVTRAGAILGTAAYMSPEQARGRVVDKRTDIWAFGCVLFEMLSGRPAFAADDVIATLAAVVKDPPDWTALPAGTPTAVRRLLEWLLDKDPRKRARDIGDVRIELDRLDASAPAPAPVARRAGVTSVALAAALAGLAIGAFGAWFAVTRPSAAASPGVLRLSMRLPSDQRITPAARMSDAGGVAMSPDGSRVVYSANNRLFMRPLDAFDATPIAGTEAGSSPFFSSDGQSIGFEQNGKLVKLRLPGGAPTPLADVAFFGGARWGADDVITYAAAPRGVFRVSGDGGRPEEIVPPDPGMVVVLPQSLPGSEWVIYVQMLATGGQPQTWAVSRRTKQRHIVLERGLAIYLRSGHLLYNAGSALGLPSSSLLGNLSVAPFDTARAVISGPSVAVSLAATDVTTFDVSPNGHIVYTTAQPGARRTLQWMTRDGTPTPLRLEPGGYRFPRLSPDGRRLALTRTSTQDLSSDVWLYDVDGTTASRLTFDGQSMAAAWTSDGRRLAYTGPRSQLMTQDADGTGRPRTLGENQFARYPYLFFDNNTRLLFSELHQTTLDVGSIEIAGGRDTMLLASGASETRPDLSPDGRWLAYTSNESGRDEVYVRPLADLEGGKWQVSTDGGHSPRWMPGGRELVFRGRGHMMGVQIRPDAAFKFDAPHPLFADTFVNDTGGRSFDVAPDGRFLMLKDELDSADQIEIIYNWFDELKRVLNSK